VVRPRPLAVAITLLTVLAGGPLMLVVCGLLCAPAQAVARASQGDPDQSAASGDCHLAEAVHATVVGAAPGHPCGNHDSVTSPAAWLKRGRTESTPTASAAPVGLLPTETLARLSVARPTGALPPVSPPRPPAAPLILRI
jgi:hypothetical protein